MKFEKKQYTAIFVGALIIIAAVAVWLLFFNGKKVEDPNASNTPVPPNSPNPKWVPEAFPFNIGMFGTKIKALQKALGFADGTCGTCADGRMGTYTANAIKAKGYSIPLSQNDYNSIVSSKGGNAATNIKGAYAKYDNTIVRDNKFNEKRKLSKDQYIGMVTGEDSTGDYYEIDGLEYVIKTSAYLKG